MFGREEKDEMGKGKWPSFLLSALALLRASGMVPALSRFICCDVAISGVGSWNVVVLLSSLVC